MARYRAQRTQSSSSALKRSRQRTERWQGRTGRLLPSQQGSRTPQAQHGGDAGGSRSRGRLLATGHPHGLRSRRRWSRACAHHGQHALPRRPRRAAVQRVGRCRPFRNTAGPRRDRAIRVPLPCDPGGGHRPRTRGHRAHRRGAVEVGAFRVLPYLARRRARRSSDAAVIVAITSPMRRNHAVRLAGSTRDPSGAVSVRGRSASLFSSASVVVSHVSR